MIVNEVNKFEEHFKIQLPTNYKNFMIETGGNGKSFEFYTFEIDYNGILTEFGFIDFESLIDVWIGTESLWEFIPENIDEKNIFVKDADCFVRITWDVSACAILLGVKKEYYGKVYLLDKEPLEPTMELRKFIIANSFGELTSPKIAIQD